MDLGITGYGLSLAAGTLSLLSPCVLPLLPILLGSAALSHRLGAYALALGLMLSFTTVGVAVVGLGSAAGLDPTMFRLAGGGLMTLFGVLLLSAALQEKFAAAASGAGGAAQALLSRLTLEGLPGQFVLGLVLGVVWSPCVGPTLGAAITLASQGQALPQVTLVMALFSLGAGIPLIAVGALSRQALTRWRSRLLGAGRGGRKLLGGILLLLGLLIVSGADKPFEAWLLSAAPDWLVNLTIRF